MTAEVQYARADAVAGLAREVAGLRRRLEETTSTTEALPAEIDVVAARIDDVARTVSQLADVVAATPPRASPSPAPSWLAAPADPAAVHRVLSSLCAWLGRVFLRYPDGAAALPECWLWHPEVVEELLWLQFAWSQAYEGQGASVSLAGDWHDRQRPGVVRRFRSSVAGCSREKHQERPGWSNAPATAPVVHGLEAVGSIADWWARRREAAPPEPAPRGESGRLSDVLHAGPPSHLSSVPGTGGSPGQPRQNGHDGGTQR